MVLFLQEQAALMLKLNYTDYNGTITFELYLHISEKSYFNYNNNFNNFIHFAKWLNIKIMGL